MSVSGLSTVLLSSGIVFVDQVLHGPCVRHGLRGSWGRGNGLKSDVHATRDNSLLVVVKVWSNDDFVGGDRGLDGVPVQVSRDDDTANG